MKTDNYLYRFVGRCWRHLFDPVFGCTYLSIATASLGLLAPQQTQAQDQEVILHPGTITGEIKIMDPDNPSMPLPISYLFLSANASFGSTNYNANCTLNNTNRYTLTVEGGPWPWRITVRTYVPKLARYYNWTFNSVAVAEGQTVTKDFIADAFLDLQLEVKGETVMQLRPSVDYYMNSSNSFNIDLSNFLPTNRVILPVVATTSYGPYTAVRIYGKMLNSNISIQPEAKTNVLAAAGQTTPVVFTIEPGYVQGTITLTGVTFQYGTVSATTRKTSTNSAGSTSFSLGNSLEFRFPCVPALASNISVSCSLTTDKGNLGGQYQYPNVPPGQTAICNWEFNYTASIAGRMDVVGFPVTNSGSYGKLTAYGPSQYVDREFNPPWGGEYELASLNQGVWNLHPSYRNYRGTNISGASCYRAETYSFPTVQLQIPAGARVTNDFTFTPGFLTGRILDPNSGALPFLYGSFIYHKKCRPGQPLSFEAEENTEISTPAWNPRPEFANLYWAFACPGIWQLSEAVLYFQSTAASGLKFSSSIDCTDQLQYHNVPAQTVSESATNELNLDYKTGQIFVRLRVADGRPLSNPFVSGNYLSNSFGLYDKYVSISGSANSANVTEGLVQLFTLPGTYQLTAQATVSGSTTTFGPPFRVTIDPGDIVEKDPDGPEVAILFPPGEYLTCDDSYVATGTVTDASGVASFTINGQTVTLDAQGNFSFPVSNLTVGKNTLHLEATDTYGKRTSVDRTVIRNGIPVAKDDSYELYDDEVLSLPAPGVLANDTDADQDPFTVVAHTTPAQGTLLLRADGALSYNPVRGTGGTFPFTYTIADGKCGSSNATVTLKVKVRNQPPVLQASTSSLNEDSPLTLTLATDPDNDPLTVSLTTGPAHGTISFAGAVLTYIPALNYNGPDSIAFTVSDGKGGVVSGTLELTILPVNDPPVLASLSLSATEVLENGSVTLSGTLSDPDQGDSHGLLIDWGDGTTSTMSLAAGQFSFSPTHQYLDDNPTGTASDAYTISVQVSDAAGLSASATTPLTVKNAAPVITSLTAPQAPTAIGSAPEVIVHFADAGSLDTHSVTFAWGDGTANTLPGIAGLASAAHVYSLPGVYTVTVTVTDDDTGSVSQSTPYVVVYDPTGSFVTGSGSIDSPAGAYRSEPTLTGQAHFGFVSRYEKGATLPSGKTEFRFVAADLDFHSTSFEWLVVAGAKAKFKGAGPLNGAGDYGFMVTVTDGALHGTGNNLDQFRIQIWDRGSGQKVYDNQFADDQLADATQLIATGAIEIHQVR